MTLGRKQVAAGEALRLSPSLRFTAIAVVVVAAVTTASVLRSTYDMDGRVVAIGLGFVAAGAVAWARRPSNRTGLLMIAYGFLIWWANPVTRVAPLWTLQSATESVGIVGVFFYMLLAFPNGRLSRSKVDRFGFWFIVFVFLTRSTIFSPFYDPAAFGCGDCQPNLNLLLIKSRPDIVDRAALFGSIALPALALYVGAVLVARWKRATKPARRVIGPMVVPGAVACLVIAEQSLVDRFVLRYWSPFVPTPRYANAVFNITTAALLALALTFVLGIIRSEMRRVQVGKLIVELGELPSPEMLEVSLARALGDPSLRVGTWDPNTQRYVAANGEEIAEPIDGSNLVATGLAREGRPIALMVHDRALLEEPGLVEATAAATRLAVENEQLQAEIRHQLDEVRASRQRILAAQDQERRRLERDLHDGAQQRLLRLSMALQVASSALPDDPDPALRTSLEVAAEELQSALHELRDLAQGIHPAVLTQRGLGAATRTLAETATIPVVIEAVPSQRLDADVEAAAYFVIAEALTNVAKHAGATRATVHAALDDNDLVITVTDDGAGGASSDRGSGLRGLADRVEALDGTVEVDSEPGRGTTLRARIPSEHR